MTTNAFWAQYFEDAYRDAAKARRELIDRGLLLIAHLIRDELPTAAAITVNAGVLTAVHDAENTIWRFNDQATVRRLSEPTRARVRNTLLDINCFASGPSTLVHAGWDRVSDLDSLRVALPADPDQEQDQPHGTPGGHAGNCAQCGRLLIWDQTGRRPHDSLGEYLCDGIRPADARSAVHLLTEPAAATTQPATRH